MSTGIIDFSTLRKALSQLEEALVFWQARDDADPLKPHLRAAVIQAFEFTYELSVRMLRRELAERAQSADSVTDLSFNDLLRKAADAGLMTDPIAWRTWRAMRNSTSHTYDEPKADEVALAAREFAPVAAALLSKLQRG